jgi:hypothetical protein
LSLVKIEIEAREQIEQRWQRGQRESREIRERDRERKQ